MGVTTIGDIVRTGEADLSILWPFTADQIADYVVYLRREGAVLVAASVEAALPRWMSQTDQSLSVSPRNTPPA